MYSGVARLIVVVGPKQCGLRTQLEVVAQASRIFPRRKGKSGGKRENANEKILLACETKLEVRYTRTCLCRTRINEHDGF